MKILKHLFLATSLFATLAVLPASAGSFSDVQKGELEEIIRGYLLEHPEILREMADKLESQ